MDTMTMILAWLLALVVKPFIWTGDVLERVTDKTLKKLGYEFGGW